MTIISQLGYYKILYGPQVLLQMNIAYFLPSIPLLGLSSQFDERLDQKFGKLHGKSLINSDSKSGNVAAAMLMHCWLQGLPGLFWSGC